MRAMLEEAGYQVDQVQIVPDDLGTISRTLMQAADEADVALIVTTAAPVLRLGM